MAQNGTKVLRLHFYLEVRNVVLYSGINPLDLTELLKATFSETIGRISKQPTIYCRISYDYNYLNLLLTRSFLDKLFFVEGLIDAVGRKFTIQEVCRDPMALSFSEYKISVSTSDDTRATLIPASLVRDRTSAELRLAHQSFFRMIPIGMSKVSSGTYPATRRDTSMIHSNDNQESEMCSLLNEESEDESTLIFESLAKFVRKCIQRHVFTTVAGNILDGLIAKRNVLLLAAYKVSREKSSALSLVVLLEAICSDLLTEKGPEKHDAQTFMIELVEESVRSSVLSFAEAHQIFAAILRMDENIAMAYNRFKSHKKNESLLRELIRFVRNADITFGQSFLKGGFCEGKKNEHYSAGKVIPFEVSSSWEVASLDTVRSEDDIVTPRLRNAEQDELDFTFAVENEVKCADDKKDANRKCLVAEKMQREGLFSRLDIDILKCLISQGHLLVLETFDQWADVMNIPAYSSGTCKLYDRHFLCLLQRAIEMEKSRQAAVAKAHAAHEQVNWASVPKDFLNFLQVTETQGHISHEDALLICSAFIHNFEIVHAAWEVFEQDNDESELLDTIQRVIRSDKFHCQMLSLIEEYENIPLCVDESSTGETTRSVSAGHFHADAQGKTVVSAHLAELLQNLAKENRKNSMLTHEQRNLVTRPSIEPTPVLLAAVQVDKIDLDEEELEVTLNRGIGITQVKRARKENDNQQVLDLVEMLHEDNLLNDKMIKVLRMLIERRDGSILTAYEAYSATQDLHSFIEALRRIASYISTKGLCDASHPNDFSRWMGKIRGDADGQPKTSTSTWNDKSTPLSFEERRQMLLFMVQV